MDDIPYTAPLAIREPWLIKALSERQLHRCCYCTLPTKLTNTEQQNWANLATFDHVVPKSHGGCDCDANLVMACRRCNLLRGRVHPLVFMRIIRYLFRHYPELYAVWHNDAFQVEYWFPTLRDRLRKIQKSRLPLLI